MISFPFSLKICYSLILVNLLRGQFLWGKLDLGSSILGTDRAKFLPPAQTVDFSSFVFRILLLFVEFRRLDRSISFQNKSFISCMC